ncbi:hypothetical protein ACIPRI_22275 [Variovorax sp. LARHSF232]
MGSRVFASVCATALVCACATQHPSTTPGTGAGAGYAPLVDMHGVDADAFATDVAACRDVASNVRVMPLKGESNDIADAVLLGVGIFVPFGFVGMTLISSIAAEFADEVPTAKPAGAKLQQSTLVNCMARKGYRNIDPQVTVTYVAPPQRSGPGMQQGGRDTYVAEHYARSSFCHQDSARAVLESKGPGFERYRVACSSSGQQVVLRCEFGNCARESMEVASGQ